MIAELSTECDPSFRVLGPLAVEVGGRVAVLPRSKVVRGVLGTLLVAEGNSIVIDELIAVVWAETSGVVNRGSVHVAISRLRRWLDSAFPDSVSLTHEGGGYRLDTDLLWSDVSIIRNSLRLTPVCGAEERMRVYRGLLPLVRGPVLHDLTGLDRSHPTIRSAEVLRRQVLRDAARAALEVRCPEAVLPWFEKLLPEFVLDEELHALFIGLLAAAGRRPEALLHYDSFRRSLVDALGVEPGGNMRRLYFDLLQDPSEVIGYQTVN